MRLKPFEIDAIKRCAAEAFGPDAVVVRLFGSRARDDLRGGDIDLHVQVGPGGRGDFRAECAFLNKLEREIGELRVDVVVLGPGESPRAIDRIALAEGIVL